MTVGDFLQSAIMVDATVLDLPVVAVVDRPTVAFVARSLESGESALVLTSADRP